jgi:hypothetical protein
MDQVVYLKVEASACALREITLIKVDSVSLE